MSPNYRRFLYASAAAAALGACGDEEAPSRPSVDATFPDLGQSDGGTNDTGPVETDPVETDVPPDIVPPEDVADTVEPADVDGSSVTEPDVADGSSPPEDVVTFEPLGVTITLATDDSTEQPAALIEFARPVDPFEMRPSASDETCTTFIQLEGDTEGRCHGLVIEWTGDATARVTTARPLRADVDLTWRVTAGAPDASGLAQVPAAVELADSTPASTLTPWSAPVVVDGTDDFLLPTALIEQFDGRWNVSWDAQNLYFGISGYDLRSTNQAFYIVLGARSDGSDNPGASFTPSERWFEGHEVILPFHASHMFFGKAVDGRLELYSRTHNGVTWAGRQTAPTGVLAAQSATMTEIAIPWSAIGNPSQLNFTMYLRDLASNCAGQCVPDVGLGWMYGTGDPALAGGPSVLPVENGWLLDRQRHASPADIELNRRFGRNERPAIYQLMVRTFSNTNEARIANGTLVQNGSGRFADINERAMEAFVDMGFSHVWFTGVLQQATSTDWSSAGQPPDDPDILKGRAGSPYAVRDYFDVSPDYAVDATRRLAEFQELVDRTHEAGLEAVIDLVPNHVARSYLSDIRPDVSFGEGDDRSVFFNRDNSFFYLQSGSPPVYLPGHVFGSPISPTCVSLADSEYSCDGVYNWQGAGETEFGRVTGNNTASWNPSIDTWYETVKVNYGFNFTTRTALYPTLQNPDAAVPRSWFIVDEIVAHWQRMGVDGFRVDMAHMVPPEFMSWLLARSRARNPDVFWVAEAYDDDPAKVVGGNTLHSLLSSGFDSVYDDGSYDRLKNVYDGGGWANDMADWISGDRILGGLGLRYAENHDEVRLASALDWRFGGSNVGSRTGLAVSAVLWTAGRGPFLLYAGQETGEPAGGIEGFGGNDGRTTIFDYWSMPTFTGWVNDHRYDGAGLSPEQRTMRLNYIDLVRLARLPVFAAGAAWTLADANRTNPSFGRLGDETVSGHWATGHVRVLADAPEGQPRVAVVIANLHPTASMPDFTVRLPDAVWEVLGDAETPLQRRTLWGSLADADVARTTARTEGVPVGTIGPGEAFIFALR
jgi:glycosidase